MINRFLPLLLDGRRLWGATDNGGVAKKYAFEDEPLFTRLNDTWNAFPGRDVLFAPILSIACLCAATVRLRVKNGVSALGAWLSKGMKA